MVNFGQVICGLIATDPIIAQEAVKLIHIEYEELRPIITIEVRKYFRLITYSNILFIIINKNVGHGYIFF